MFLFSFITLALYQIFLFFSSIFKYFVVVLSVSCRELNVNLIQSESFVHLKS